MNTQIFKSAKLMGRSDSTGIIRCLFDFYVAKSQIVLSLKPRGNLKITLLGVFGIEIPDAIP